MRYVSVIVDPSSIFCSISSFSFFSRHLKGLSKVGTTFQAAFAGFWEKLAISNNRASGELRLQLRKAHRGIKINTFFLTSLSLNRIE